ncbi:FAD-binding oxidoreductase [Nocardia sp. NPDC051570]|uniref:FAD-binding oxidoreductase n=1 Tax=Nocardia sp. NPDC051570 TaxID=3364324 RepID=UPI0037AC644C
MGEHEHGRTGLSRRMLIAAAGSLAALAVGTARADVIDPGAWESLRRQVRGTVVRPPDAEFGSAKALFDPQFDGSTPVAVVGAADADDVRTAVVFARDHGLPLAVRAGGHSYVGASATSGALIVDVRRLAEISIDGDLVTLGAGATIMAVCEALDRVGRTLPLGTCPTVGVAGLTLGGGLGVESRRYGVSCDRLVSAKLVLPNGSTADASAERLPGLFWAVRGAGGVTGIVTSLTVRTCPAESKDIVRMDFPGDAAARVLDGWARWLPAADRAVWSNIQIATRAGELGCTALITCPAGRGEAAATELAAAATVPPASVDRRTFSALDAARDLGGGPSTARSTKVAGSDVLTALSPATAESIVDAIRSRGDATGYVLIDPLDGAIRDTAPDATAFPWRAHAATLQWIVDQPDSPATARAWIAGAHRAVAAASAGAYVNYLEPGDDPRRYYGSNLDRLRTIRRTVDPDRRLRPGLEV